MPCPVNRCPDPPSAPGGGGVHGSSTEDVNQMLNAGEAIFIDARDPNEYAVGHIPGH